MRVLLKPKGADLVYEEADFRCVWCGCELRFRERPRDMDYLCSPAHATVDHLQPLTEARNNKRENLVASCLSCNSRRNVRDAETWLEHCLTKGLAANAALVRGKLAALDTDYLRACKEMAVALRVAGDADRGRDRPGIQARDGAADRTAGG